MINNALTSNVRDANGGDVAITSNTRPFTPADLGFFTQLKNNGTITSYTALTTAQGSMSNAASVTNSFTVQAVDPANFPIVTPPTFVHPSNGSISGLLTGNWVIIDKTPAVLYNKKVGHTLNVHLGTLTGGNELAWTLK